LDLGRYIPLPQHWSIVFFVSVQSSFPSFCGTQQHFVSSSSVNVQVIFGEAAEMNVALASVAINASHLLIVFMFHLIRMLRFQIGRWMSIPFSAFPIRNSSADFGRRLCPPRHPWSL
jgi:hypothetical protein